MKLIKQYRKYIRDSFYAKTVLFFSAITTVSLMLLGIVVIAIVANTLTDKEMQYENQAILSMGHYVQNMEYQFNNLLFNVTDRRYSDISNYLASEEGSEVYVDPAKITAYLNSILNSNQDILDVILIKNSDSSVLYCSKEMRALNSEYNFPAQQWYEDIKSKKNQLSILPGKPADYIKNSGERVLTYACNIYNVLYGRNTQDIGTLILNYKVHNLSKAISDYEDLKGNLLLTDRNGYVVFDSSGAYTGQQLPFFSALVPGQSKLKIGRIDYFALMNRGLLVNYVLISLSPVNSVLSQINSIRGLFMIVIAVIILSSLAITILFGRTMSKRVRLITQAMRNTENGILDQPIPVAGNDEIDRIAVGYNKMSMRLKDYIGQVYIAGIKEKSAELAALQSQINPHFLFNTLETLRMEALVNGQERIAEMIRILSNLFRWNIRNKVSTVTVRQEIQYLTYYLELQKYRLQDRLEFSIDVDAAIWNNQIIKFSLQPILENAIHHGIDKKEDGGLVQITGSRVDDRIVFEIKDNGIGIDGTVLENLRAELAAEIDLHSENIGLRNVSDRIRLMFGDQYGLQIRSDSGITSVTVSFPIIEGE